jgi:hypothetical protein
MKRIKRHGVSESRGSREGTVAHGGREEAAEEREMCLLTASEDGGREDQRRVRAGMSMLATDSVGHSLCGRSLQMIYSGWQCLGSTMHLSFVATVFCSTTYPCLPLKIFWVVSLQVGSATQK